MNEKALFGVKVPLWGREAFINRNKKIEFVSMMVNKVRNRKRKNQKKIDCDKN